MQNFEAPSEEVALLIYIKVSASIYSQKQDNMMSV